MSADLLPVLALQPALAQQTPPRRLAPCWPGRPWPPPEAHPLALLPSTACLLACRAVLSNGKGAVALSCDHKPNREDERGRIEGAGGSVVWAGTWRVGGVLAVSRSFGNRMLKQFIIPHPEIREDHLQPGAGWQPVKLGGGRGDLARAVAGHASLAQQGGTNCIAVERGYTMPTPTSSSPLSSHTAAANQCLVLASDGLWDAVGNEEAARLALRHRSQGAEAAARALVAEAYVRGSQDNITAVVVFFQFPS